MADLDDMEMKECPHCKRSCPKDFYPICTCEKDLKKNEKENKSKNPDQD
jgi:hypothetical protein